MSAFPQSVASSQPRMAVAMGPDHFRLKMQRGQNIEMESHLPFNAGLDGTSQKVNHVWVHKKWSLCIKMHDLLKEGGST